MNDETTTKHYKIDECYFEVIEFELLENANGYQVECLRAITPMQRAFKFGDKEYHLMSMHEFSNKEEITAHEFNKQLIFRFEKVAGEIAKLEDENEGMAFVIPEELRTTRMAYSKTFGIENMFEYQNSIKKD